MRRVLAGKRWLWLIMVFALVVAGWVAAKPVKALLGNIGTPVEGYMGGSLAPGNNYFMTCFTPSGPNFTDSNQRVPDGYYFLVTGITITPDAGTTINAVTDVDIYDAYGTNNRRTFITLRGVTTATYGVQYTVPYFVLTGGHRLEIVNASYSQFPVMVRVTGLLVTNVNYLPMVSAAQ
jgi:hypothetical protein